MAPDNTVDFALTIVDFLADHPGTAYSVAEIADQFDCGTWRAQILLRALEQVHLLECLQASNAGDMTYRACWPSSKASLTRGFEPASRTH